MCVLPCSKLHPDMGEVLLKEPPPGSAHLPAVLRLCGKLDLLDQVGVWADLVLFETGYQHMCH